MNDDPSLRLPSSLQQRLHQQWKPKLNRLIGVMDLMNGVAVHGIAGQRSRYRPVAELPAGENALLRWYRSIGVRRFYVADLDGLMSNGRQDDALLNLAAELRDGETLWIDSGWRGSVSQADRDWMSQMRSSITAGSDIRWIIASESADSIDVLDRMLESIPASQLTLSLDFRDGQFVGPDSATHWMQSASDRNIREAILLDVAAVGGQSGPRDCETFSRLVRQFRGVNWITGGGIRCPEDVRKLLSQGYSEVLIASALLPSSAADAASKTS
ncbi:Phosphoribosylformimino-5-aminoimidazole carboxamide ribotide isomerase -likeprotein [Rhodopirellula islandica]|uniref:Phosphoribosylformimino-5-aminoimidazole carboxamide ribotide isomerase-likeprotein n=1 Tax=Rhodopirellula islandica TaxID=595434 RepID=A0A0J1BGU8_RHOIS|nr:HisA/HisF-related TIM barrel protein [Rhodopirellula islandica]KLU05777.1 Phosphoribosylformimino-5-aminoimidazole carboxamide ribotide isomerase -likeprotein [Rhodopirellula islandica]